jgi:hypothetical protein
MWKLAVLFLSALALQAGAIQDGPYAIQISNVVVGNSSSVLDVSFYLKGPFPNGEPEVLLNAGSNSGIECPTQINSCVADFITGISIVGYGRGIGYLIETTNSGGGNFGNESGSVDLPSEGVYVAQLTLTQSLMGSVATPSNLALPVNAQVTIIGLDGETLTLIPEPATFGLAFASMAGLMAIARRWNTR